MVTNGTDRHQEIPALRAYIEQRHGGKDAWQKHLYVYDKAVTDFAWWDKQKHERNFMISVLKEQMCRYLVITLLASLPKSDSPTRQLIPFAPIVLRPPRLRTTSSLVALRHDSEGKKMIGNHEVSDRTFREAVKVVRRGCPPVDLPKKPVSIRLSPDVIEYFKSTGKGWQARMNEVLREYVMSHR